MFDPSFQGTYFDFAKKANFHRKLINIIVSNTIISRTQGLKYPYSFPTAKKYVRSKRQHH